MTMATATKDPGPIKFSAKIQSAGEKFSQNGWIEFPYDLKETYGVGNLVPVVITFDGHEYRGSIAKMGPKPALLIRKDIWQKLGKQHGDDVDVVVQLDKAERKVEVPDYFDQELSQHPEVKEIFDKMSYTHRREYVEWITSAKQEETKLRRMQKAIQMIKQSKSHS